MKKFITLSLLVSLLLGTAACGDSQTPGGETTAPSDNTTAAETSKPLSLAEQRRSVPDDLPEKTFGGEEFTIIIDSYAQTGFMSEELTGDVLSDAVFNRNKAVEERFDVRLNYVVDEWGNVTTLLRNTVTAGDDEYQLADHHALASNDWVLADILVNWYDVPYVNFDKPWWSDTNQNDLTYNGVNFLAVGDYSLTTIGRTYAIYYDKVKAKDYQMPDLYALVKEGKWTIDKLTELTRDIYTDLNNNNQRDFEDFYGYSLAKSSNVGAFLFSFGCKIIDNGEIVLDVGKTADIIQKLITVTQVNPGTFYDVNYKNSAGNIHYAGAEKMAQGTTVFASAMIESGIVYLRDANDYGILPYPKWDEEQDDYITIIDGGFTMMSIPKTVQDLERSGIIAEALCAETYKNVVPDYYDIAIKTKGTRDDESIEMIDFIMSKRVCDFGYVYDHWKGFGFCIEKRVEEADPNFASYYAANINSVTEEYQKVFDAFQNYGK